MRLLLIISVVLCVRLTMGGTNNNYCGRDPYPDITLHEFAAWDCSDDESKLPVDVNAYDIPICVKGNFSIGTTNAGPFSIVYVASVTGKIMGFIPIAEDIPMCAAGPCYMRVNCPQLKTLLGASAGNANDPNCVVDVGDVDFLVSTMLDGPVDLPAAVVSGLQGAAVNTEIDIDSDVMAGLVIKLACISEKMPLKLQK